MSSTSAPTISMQSTSALPPLVIPSSIKLLQVPPYSPEDPFSPIDWTMVSPDIAMATDPARPAPSYTPSPTTIMNCPQEPSEGQFAHSTLLSEVQCALSKHQVSDLTREYWMEQMAPAKVPTEESTADALTAPANRTVWVEEERTNSPGSQSTGSSSGYWEACRPWGAEVIWDAYARGNRMSSVYQQESRAWGEELIHN